MATATTAVSTISNWRKSSLSGKNQQLSPNAREVDKKDVDLHCIAGIRFYWNWYASLLLDQLQKDIVVQRT